MNKQLTCILSALAVCCLLVASSEALERPVEKGSKAKAEAKVVVPCGNPCPGKPPCKKPPCKKPPCPVPPPCPPQPKCPQAVYGTIVFTGMADNEWISAPEIIVPLSDLQKAQGITLDAGSNTFTLPKGTYTLHFQFVIRTDDDEPPIPLGFLKFTKMYLDINNDASRVPLDWAMALDDSGSANQNPWVSITGSRVFSVSSDDTDVKIVLVREANISGSGNIQFSSQLDFYKVESENNPVRLTLHRLDGCN